MSRIRVRFSIAVLLLSAGVSVQASSFYEWTDEKGVKHFASSLDEIPAKYQAHATPPTTKQSPRPAAAPKPVVDSPTGTVDVPLRKFEVAYQAFEGSARRVIIPVTLNDAITVPMALDTGSPGMVVSFELAERLRLLSKDNGRLLVAAAGIGGTTPAVLTIIDTVAVAGARSAFVPTTVTDKLSDAFQGLVGMDFMAGYNVSIDSKRKVLVLEEIPKGQESPGGHDEAWWRDTFQEFRETRDRWRAYAEARASNLGTQKALGDFQLRESERLLQRLNIYASENAVPQHWR